MNKNKKVERMINMKKNILTTLSAVLLAGLVGCSSGEETKSNLNDTNESNQNNTVQVTDNNGAIAHEPENYAVIYGKVKKIIGNEIELSLAHNPYENMEEGEEDEMEIADEFPITMADSIQLYPDADPALVEELEKAGVTITPMNMKGMELEYTGEEESYTIPTGVAIMNYKTSSEGSFNDIKEGSVICLTVSGTGNAQKIHMIDILE